MNAIIQDWQINGMFGAFSGTPFTVTADGTAVNTPSNQQTADLVGTVTTLGGVGANQHVFRHAAWAQPTGVRFGTTGRNQFYGPGGWSLDLLDVPLDRAGRDQDVSSSASKDENFLNHPVFGNPDGGRDERHVHADLRIFPAAAAGNVGLSNAVYMERRSQAGHSLQF